MPLDGWCPKSGLNLPQAEVPLELLTGSFILFLLCRRPVLSALHP